MTSARQEQDGPSARQEKIVVVLEEEEEEEERCPRSSQRTG
jgi:hypothetical protein